MGVYFAFINLKIGGMSWIADTEAIMQIDNIRMVQNTGNVVIEVYDDTAIQVETELIKQESREFEYWYGYQGGAQSEHYTAVATKITPQFTGEGIILTIEGVSTSAYASMNGSEGKAYTGTPAEIVQQVAAEEGWTIDTIVSTKDPGGTANTYGNTEKFQAYREAHQSAEQFISNSVVPFAESEDGLKNYQLIVKEEDGGTICSFYPAGYKDSGEVFTYVVGAPSEEIISFEPQYGEFLYALMGSNGGTADSKDALSNEDVRTQTVVDKPAAEVTVPAKNSLPTTTTAQKSSTTETQQEILTNNVVESLQAKSYQATLILKGKPNIPVGENISVKVFSKEGIAHFSSGKYMIQTAEDVIEGDFTTTLMLIRADQAQTSSNTQRNGGDSETFVKGRKIGDFYVRALYDKSVVSSNLSGSSDEEKIWNFLMGKLQNAIGTAALMGNLYAESRCYSKCVQGDYLQKDRKAYDEAYTSKVDTSYSESQFCNDKTGGGGYGLAQWTSESRKQGLYQYAKKKSKSIGDLQMQLEFLWKELNGDGTSTSYNGVLSALKSATDLYTATVKVLIGFEKPADQSQSVKNTRKGYAQTYYDRYHGNKGDSSGGVYSSDTVIVTDPKEIAIDKKVFINDHIYQSKKIPGKSVSGKNIDMYCASESEKKAWKDGTYAVYEAVKQNTPSGNATGPSDGAIPPSIYYTACQPYLGWPYVWGGESQEEGGYDCSGFIYALFKGLGYNWTRNTAAGQAGYGLKVEVSGSGYGLDKAIPGDLLFNYHDGGISHVMCYLGNGYMVHAPHEGDVVKIAKVKERPYCIRRLI